MCFNKAPSRTRLVLWGVSVCAAIDVAGICIISVDICDWPIETESLSMMMRPSEGTFCASVSKEGWFIAMRACG